MFSNFSTDPSGNFSFQSNSFSSDPFGTSSNSPFGTTSGSGFTNSFDTTSFSFGEPATEPFIRKEPEPEKVVPSQETQLFDKSSMKKFAHTLFEQIIKPELSTALDSENDYYKERVVELEDRLSAMRRFMYAKGLERSYEQWLTARIRRAKEEDNDEPLSISLQHGMRDVEIMRD